MKANKVKTFITLAGQALPSTFNEGTPEDRELGAQLLLSETLEYVIKGLGVIPKIGGVSISDPNGLSYEATSTPIDKLEMLDGLADVAYTMYWNALRFGIPLEEAYEMVCDNNLEKFVKIETGALSIGSLPKESWDLGSNVSWPLEVTSVSIIDVDGCLYAVGKDASGKVRKPSTYSSVDLGKLLT